MRHYGVSLTRLNAPQIRYPLVFFSLQNINTLRIRHQINDWHLAAGKAFVPAASQQPIRIIFSSHAWFTINKPTNHTSCFILQNEYSASFGTIRKVYSTLKLHA